MGCSLLRTSTKVNISLAVYDVYALRDIEEGEELTHDYTANAVGQFAGQGFWVLECQCGSENCRGKLRGDFLRCLKDGKPSTIHVCHHPSKGSTKTVFNV